MATEYKPEIKLSGQESIELVMIANMPKNMK